MLSAFGVDHGTISKADAPKKRREVIKPDAKLPRVAGNMVPASTARAFDNSTKHKGQAAGLVTAGKIAGSVAGGAAGIAVASKLTKNPRFFKEGSKIALRAVSAKDKRNAARYAGMTVGGAVGSTALSEASSRHIRRSSRYGYKERGL
jgi:hypothetical protein